MLDDSHPHHPLPRTPKRRRRKIPSFSPRKNPKYGYLSQRPSTAHHQSPTKEPLSTSSDDIPVSGIIKDPFPDIPLWNDLNSTHRNPSSDERMRILTKLREKWPHVAAFTVAFPWMLIEIDEDSDLPPPRSTPRSPQSTS